jgi:hypothetical protein
VEIAEAAPGSLTAYKDRTARIHGPKQGLNSLVGNKSPVDKTQVELDGVVRVW